MDKTELKHILEQHSLWVRNEGGQRADLWNANLRNADLSSANLSGANLWNANLSSANLSGANLWNANLSGANLSGANLSSANLRNADLSSANLSGANLSGANLWNANLSGANLSSANLRNADLSSANLRDAYLWNANLRNADLSHTYLDPDADIPRPSTEAIARAGLELVGNYVYGYRTMKSAHFGSHVYTPGVHIAPWFSIEQFSPCHPGIYLSSEDWLANHYSGCDTVRCYCHLSELVHAGDKWRAKRIRVLPAGHKYAVEHKELINA